MNIDGDPYARMTENLINRVPTTRAEVKPLLPLVQKILEFADNGDPIKDAIEPSGYRQDELLVILARHYAATLDSFSREKADL